MVMTVPSVPSAAEKSMSAPFPSVLFSVRMASSPLVSNSPPLASLRIASVKVRVMLRPALPTRAPSAGLKVGAAGAVVSTLKVALAAAPRLPWASK